MYAVVSHYSFDYPQVDLFETMEQARSYLIEVAKEEYKIATEANGWDATLEFDSEIENDISGATLTMYFVDHTDITEFELASLVVNHVERGV